MSPRDDFLQEFEEGMARVLGNLNAYIQPEGVLNQSLNKSQSIEDSGHVEIFPSWEAADQAKEVDT